MKRKLKIYLADLIHNFISSEIDINKVHFFNTISSFNFEVINEKMDCVDSSVSITEEQMTQMVAEIRRIEKIFGEGNLGVRNAENGTLSYRRFSSLR